ncbi:MAG: hypothetical protein LQ338_006777 [Usnochroma carphineum]|nr:MAG: hypothetical protein LQ338_006777 [Usnochroma carphineum]
MSVGTRIGYVQAALSLMTPTIGKGTNVRVGSRHIRKVEAFDKILSSTMSLPTAPSSTVPSHESPANSDTLSTNTSSAVSEALGSVPGADVGSSAGSSAGSSMKGQVEELADKVFEQREGKEKEGAAGGK